MDRSEERPEEVGSGAFLSSVVRQVGWSTMENVADHGLRFLFLVVLARLLAPSAFGIFTQAVIVTSLLGTAAALGLETALVQREEADPRDYSTAAIANVGFSVVLCLLAALLAPLAAWVFGSPGLHRIVPVAAIGPAFSTAALSPRARLRRRLDFKSLCLASLTGTAVGGGVALGMAYAGAGVWSLVVQLVTSSLLTSGYLWVAADVSLAPGFSADRLRSMVKFGGPYTGEQFLNFLNRRADDFVIGVFLGDAALGYYRVAYSTLTALTRVLAGSLNSVALPVFSKVAADRERLRLHFLRSTEVALLVAVPACVGFAAVADLVIPFFYGPGWEPAVPAARVLAFVALAHSALLFNPTVMYALGRSDLQLRLTALYAVVNIVGFVIGVRWGILGVAAAYALQNLLTAPFELAVVRRLIRLRVPKYLRQLWRPGLAALLMLAAVMGFREAVGLGRAPMLGSAVVVGVSAYLLALLATGPTYLIALGRSLGSSPRT